MMKTTLVVAAVILREGKVLMTQREAGAHLALRWEFPGGKVEPGESPPEALVRELAEELGVEPRVDEPFAFNWHDYGEKRILLLTYLARFEGTARRLGCRDLGWFDGPGVAGLELPEADAPILARLMPLLD